MHDGVKAASGPRPSAESLRWIKFGVVSTAVPVTRSGRHRL